MTSTRLRSRKGQAAAEFALIVPVVLALLVGIVEFGRAWQNYQVVTHAAREAARISVTPFADDAQVLASIHTSLRSASMDTSLVQVELRTRVGTGTADTVLIRYPYQFRTVGAAMRILKRGSSVETPGTVYLTSLSIMRNE